MAKGFKVTRRCSGSYTVSKPVRVVDQADHELLSSRKIDVTYFPELKGWIARAEWTNDWYTDPVETLRDAKQCAFSMLAEQDVKDQERLTKARELRKLTAGM
jgi:hypothetical protein